MAPPSNGLQKRKLEGTSLQSMASDALAVASSLGLDEKDLIGKDGFSTEGVFEELLNNQLRDLDARFMAGHQELKVRVLTEYRSQVSSILRDNSLLSSENARLQAENLSFRDQFPHLGERNVYGAIHVNPLASQIQCTISAPVTSFAQPSNASRVFSAWDSSPEQSEDEQVLPTSLPEVIPVPIDDVPRELASTHCGGLQMPIGSTSPAPSSGCSPTRGRSTSPVFGPSSRTPSRSPSPTSYVCIVQGPTCKSTGFHVGDAGRRFSHESKSAGFLSCQSSQKQRSSSDDTCSDRLSGQAKDPARSISLASRGSVSSMYNMNLDVLEVWSKKTRKHRRSTRGKELELWQQMTASYSTPVDNQGPREGLEWFMIHPSSMKRICWDLSGLLLIGYDCVFVPLEVFEPHHSPMLRAMFWIIRIFWTINIPVSFFTGFFCSQGTAEMKPMRVARRYASTWLPFDLIVVVFGWTEVVLESELGAGGTARIGSTLRVLRLCRTARLIQLIKAPAITQFITDNIRSEELMLVATIAKITFFMMLVAHFMACLWYGLGVWVTVDGTDGRETTWVKDNDLSDSALGVRYAWSVHWAVSQFTGEALITPMNVVERVFSSIVLFLCFISSTAFVSSFTTAMTRIQLISNRTFTQIAGLRRYLVDCRISRQLAVRVQHNALHALAEQKRNAPESSVVLLGLISEPLLVEMHFEIHFRILTKHPFFCFYQEINPAGIRKICHTAVSILSLSRGDVLFSDCEIPGRPSMYFVVRGQMEYSQEQEDGSQRASKVVNGDWFGEHVLWTSWTHLGTMVAATETQLLVLDAEKFQGIAKRFPTEHPKKYAEIYVHRLNTKGKLRHGDLGERVQGLHNICTKIFWLSCGLPNGGGDDSSSSEESVDDHTVKRLRAVMSLKPMTMMKGTRAGTLNVPDASGSTSSGIGGMRRASFLSAESSNSSRSTVSQIGARFFSWITPSFEGAQQTAVHR